MGMKEISYDGPPLDEESNRKKERSRGSVVAQPIRTFRGDVNQMLEEKHVTKTQVMLAEQERREKRGEKRLVHSDESHLGRIIMILLIVLAFGVGVGIYALLGTKQTELDADSTASTAQKPERQASEEILITDSPREQIMADVLIAFGKTSLASGKARAITFVAKNEGFGKRDATLGEVMSAISISKPPKQLLSSLKDSFMFGFYVGENVTTGYLLLQSRSYADTFSGVLVWENTMSDDIIPLLHPNYGRTGLAGIRQKAFEDERVGTIDARTLKDVDGSTLIVYAIIDKSVILIAGNEEVFLGTLATLHGETKTETETP